MALECSSETVCVLDSKRSMRLIDIGANLLDPMFRVRCMCCYGYLTSCSSQTLSKMP